MAILCGPAVQAGRAFLSLRGEVRPADDLGAAAQLLGRDPQETLVVIGPETPASEALSFAADPAARQAAEELIAAVGLEPGYLGDAGAAGTVDALLPLWFALVQQHGGNRRLALRLVT